jgi:hypothetical protein
MDASNGDLPFLVLAYSPTPHKCWLVYWGDGRRLLVVGLVGCRGVGCHRLSPVVTGCHRLWVTDGWLSVVVNHWSIG